MKTSNPNVIVLPRIRTKAERDYMPWVDAFGKREDGKLVCYARCYDCDKLRAIADTVSRMCKECFERQK